MDAPIKEYRKYSSNTCKHEGCDLKHSAHGYCNIHYKRSIRGSDMDTPINKGPRICIQEGCDRKHLARGYCGAHYLRYIEGRDMDEPIRKHVRK